MAVYTEVTDEALVRFLARYEIGALVAFQGIAEGVENSNYALKTTQGDFILTLYEKRVTRKDLPYFLALMAYLRGQGLPCPMPIRARSGESLQELAGRAATITSFLPGVWPRHVQPFHCEHLGAALAGLHIASSGFTMTRYNRLGPSSWAGLLAASLSRADELRPGLAADLQAWLPRILAEWPRTLPQGQIHADLFPDNVFFLDGRISGLIDFYFACTDSLAYDIAICMNSWCFTGQADFNTEAARALLRGYQAVRQLCEAELAALPILARGAALRFLLTRLYDWLHTSPGAFVTLKDPLEYYHRLRFHIAVSGASVYGV